MTLYRIRIARYHSLRNPWLNTLLRRMLPARKFDLHSRRHLTAKLFHGEETKISLHLLRLIERPRRADLGGGVNRQRPALSTAGLDAPMSDFLPSRRVLASNLVVVTVDDSLSSTMDGQTRKEEHRGCLNRMNREDFLLNRVVRPFFFHLLLSYQLLPPLSAAVTLFSACFSFVSLASSTPLHVLT